MLESGRPETGVYPLTVQSGHFLSTGDAPRRPNIEQYELAAKIVEDANLPAVAIGDRYRGQELGRHSENEIARGLLGSLMLEKIHQPQDRCEHDQKTDSRSPAMSEQMKA